MQGDKGRETNEEGRFWESACRETNEGRQMKKGDRSGSDFGNQHAGRQMKGDK